MTLIFFAHKKSDTDADISNWLKEAHHECTSKYGSDYEIVTGKEDIDDCKNNGEFESWPQWQYSVTERYDVLIIPSYDGKSEHTLGKATYDMCVRMLQLAKPVYFLGCEGDEDLYPLQLHEAMGVEKFETPKGAKESWIDYGYLTFD